MNFRSFLMSPSIARTRQITLCAPAMGLMQYDWCVLGTAVLAHPNKHQYFPSMQASSFFFLLYVKNKNENESQHKIAPRRLYNVNSTKFRTFTFIGMFQPCYHISSLHIKLRLSPGLVSVAFLFDTNENEKRPTPNQSAYTHAY